MVNQNLLFDVIRDSLKMVWTGIVLTVSAIILGLFMFSSLAMDILVNGITVQYVAILIVFVVGLTLMGAIGVATRRLVDDVFNYKVYKLRESTSTN